jgi:GNAT superfamily N-acetyltransferase
MSVSTCSVCDNLIIRKGDSADYRSLERYHYRGERLGCWSDIYVLADRQGQSVISPRAAGVIVYVMANANLELRRYATYGAFTGLGSAGANLDAVNRHIRRIARVIIEPRYRRLGLAVRLVKETMPLVGVDLVESAAVMGRYSPFFEKAGMRRYDGPAALRNQMLIEAFEAVGIERGLMTDSEAVWERYQRLGTSKRRFLQAQTERFLQPYKNRRLAPDGYERLAYVLSKLGPRCSYFAWVRPGARSWLKLR